MPTGLHPAKRISRRLELSVRRRRDAQVPGSPGLGYADP
jgi:hypothetical protein